MPEKIELNPLSKILLTIIGSLLTLLMAFSAYTVNEINNEVKDMRGDLMNTRIDHEQRIFILERKTRENKIRIDDIEDGL